MEETGSPLLVAIEPAVLHLGVGARGISPTHINISTEPSEEHKKRKEKLLKTVGEIGKKKCSWQSSQPSNT